MEKIIDIIKNAKVEWKQLGEICEIKRGRVISKQDIEENFGKYPVYSSQTQNNGEIGKISTYDFDGDYITWTTDGAHAGTVFFRSGKFSVTNVCGLIKNINDNINLKYISYYLEITTKKYVVAGSGNPKLMSNVISKIPIPIPSLKTQEKIVEILDNFINIEKELEKRKKQYEYYRKKLLTLDEEKIVIKKLSEVLTIKRGKRITKRDLIENGKYPVVSGGVKFMGYIDKYNRNENTITIAQYGTAGYVNIQKEKFWANDVCFSLFPKEEILNKYLYYFLTNKQNYLYEISNKNAIPYNISKEKILEIKIPIPDIKVQEEIVNILEQFEKLINDIEEGLPKEIELRKKQYEYYRKKILTFK